MEAEIRAQRLKMLIFDVDGVFTAGQLFFNQDGEAMKAFHAHDGLGITLARKAGLKTAIITGRQSEMVSRRATELAINDVCQGAVDKIKALDELLAKYGFSYEDAGYAGDDLNDLGIMARIGLACAVANAVPEVKAAAHYIADKQGGNGAVREIIEFVLKAQGKWELLVEQFSQSGDVDSKQ